MEQIEFITLFGIIKEGRPNPEKFFRDTAARDTELARLNASTLKFSMQMDINCRYHKAIDIPAVVTDDGRYFALSEIMKVAVQE